MKIIKREMPRDMEKIELHVFSDEHIGDTYCDMFKLKQRIEYVKEKPNAFFIMNGDILDFATRDSVGDIEGRWG